MELPTRTRRRRGVDQPLGVLWLRKWVVYASRRPLVWLCACCVALLLLPSLFYGENAGLSPRESAISASSEPPAALLDGKMKLQKTLPASYPNRDVNRFNCDLPALRYACDMDDKHGCRAYPQLFKAGDLMRNWSPNEIHAPAKTFSSLCRFNVSSPYELALAHVFHAMEVPFIVYGIPELTAASAKWTPAYLTENLGRDERYRVHVANSTHFMFYTRRTLKPTTLSEATSAAPRPYDTHFLSYDEFLDKATRGEENISQYFYLMLKADDIRGRASFAQEDLPFLDPDSHAQLVPPRYGDLFLRDRAYARGKGMRCRFGMPGIITEGHVDAGLNVVAMVRGRKRYILSPPSVCSCLGLHTSGPSMRHTSVDWADVANGENKTLYECPTTEVVVGEGDVLYIPSYWYHHIVSLDHTIQCNVRSGIIARDDVTQFLLACGLAGF